MDDESRVPKVRRGPMEPTREERLLHEATHMPFRSWCRFCVIANAESNPQFKRKEEGEKTNPSFHMVIGSYGMEVEAKSPKELV